jgi:hypothetical protein
MKTNTKSAAGNKETDGADFAKLAWKESWDYIRTVVDTVREPFLVLDKDLRVMVANESFYRTFQVDPKETESKLVYNLGNGQWDIPALRKLLEDILPQNTFFKGFEVTHEFPHIGRKIMILNARRINRDNATSSLFPPIILLAMEDVTEMMAVAEKLAVHAAQFETMMLERTQNMETHVRGLEKQLNELKRKPNL